MLADKRFKERAIELKTESESMDYMKTIERQIIEFSN